jgi:hypothetical protein
MGELSALLTRDPVQFAKLLNEQKHANLERVGKEILLHRSSF